VYLKALLSCINNKKFCSCCLCISVFNCSWLGIPLMLSTHQQTSSLSGKTGLVTTLILSGIGAGAILFIASRKKKVCEHIFHSFWICFTVCRQVNFVSIPFPISEETVVRDFKLLSAAFLSDLLDIFLKSSNAKQNFQHGPIKIGELGTEVSHVGALVSIKGFKYEGFLLQTSAPGKTLLAQQIREKLLQSKFWLLFF